MAISIQKKKTAPKAETKQVQKIIHSEAVVTKAADRVCILQEQLDESKDRIKVITDKMAKAKADLLEKTLDRFTDPGKGVDIPATGSLLRFSKEKESTQVASPIAVFEALKEIDEDLPWKLMNFGVTALKKYMSENEVNQLTDKSYGGVGSRTMKLIAPDK